MRTSIRRHAGALLAALGLLGLIGCFLAMAGEALPYPDPTPDLLAAQAARLRVWQAGMAISALLLLSGGLWQLRARSSPR